MHTIFHQLKKSKPLRLANNFRAPQLTSQQRFFAVSAQSRSQVTKDYQQTLQENSRANQSEFTLSKVARNSDKLKVPDYNVPGDRMTVKLRVSKDKLSAQEHPLETMAKANRTMNDAYAKLGPNEVLITNLPKIQTQELASPHSVSEFLVKNVHKDLQVKEVKFIDSLSTPNLKSRPAYLKVVVGSKRQAQLIKQSLRKTWVHDSLLKVKTADDAKTEVFDNRTIVLSGIPKHLRAEQVIEYFGKDAGAVVGLELPQENVRLSELRRKQAEAQDTPENVEKEIDRRRAMIAVDQGLNAEGNVLEQMKNPVNQQSYSTLRQEGRNLEQERVNGVLRLVTQLQAEGMSVLEQKVALLDLKERASSASSVSEQASQEASFSPDALKQSIEQNRELVGRSIDYLRQNSEEISAKALTDPLSDLLQLGREELATTYDRMIVALGDREKAIEARLRSSIQHYGIGERILMEGKNFTKELEDVPVMNEEPNGTSVKIENIISVGQQVSNVLNEKNLDPQTKIYRLLSRTLNPFETNFNFSEQQLKDTTSSELFRWKVAHSPDPRIPASLQYLFHQGSEFVPEKKKLVDKMIAEQRENFNQPFDELYHKQKKMIQEVIDAEKALKAKLESLTDPFDQYMIDPSKLSPEQRSEAQDLLNNLQSPFNASKRRQREELLDTKVRQIAQSDAPGSYKFEYSETADLRSQVKQGLISQKQASQIETLIKEGEEQNLGYAFLTFSHADEARLFLLEHRNPYFGLEPVEIFLKSSLDHSSMDMQYFMAQARNSARTVDEIQKVREARQQLRNFERDMDSQLPSRKRLQKFRRYAQSLIEDHKYLTNREEQFGELRNKLDQDRFDRKVKAFEAAHPNVDLTAIYQNEKTEAARRTLHKKAYASYKAFHFLKNGIKKGEQADIEPELSAAKQRLRDSDPYNFPELDRSVRSVLTSSVDLPQLNDAGDVTTTPGRRINGYSEREYIESFFGKDLTRRLQTETRHDPLYVEQKTFKERFPLNGFLKTPGVLERKKMLKDQGLDNDSAKFPYLLPKDDNIAAYMQFQDSADLTFLKSGEAQVEDNPKAASYLNEFEKVWQDHADRHKKKHDHNGQYIDAKFLDNEVKKLEFQMNRGRFADDEDWYSMFKNPRTQREDVEHRMYEQHYNEQVHSLQVNNAGQNIGVQPNEGKGGDRGGKGEDSAEVEVTATDELKEAKFESEYPSDDKADKPARSQGGKKGGVRENRKNRGKVEKPKFGQDPEIAKLIKMAKKERAPYTLYSSDAPEIMTEQEHKIAKMMSMVSPEEREDLHQIYQAQRISKLENLQNLAETEGIDSKTLQELAEQGEGRLLKSKTQDSYQSRVQGEADYIKRAEKERGNDIDYIADEARINRNGSTEQRVKMQVRVRKRDALNKATLNQSEERFSGDWFRKYQTQADKLQEGDAYEQTQQRGKMLDEFITQKDREIDVDDDEDDIYRQYQEMASRSGQVRDKDEQAYSRADADALKPKMPRLDEYFRNEADGVHPFDKIASSFDQSEIGTAEEAKAEKAREDELYKREILGRLMGQTISPAQYELLQGQFQNEELRQKRMLDTNNEEFLNNRQQVRLMQETAEKIRRQKVISREWKESESHDKLQEYLEQVEDKFETEIERNRFLRDLKAAIRNIKETLSPETLLEKEYHFDEGVGVSLNEHVAQLKKSYPTAKVQTRRDREGFAVVKVSFVPEFKYDLDTIMEADDDTMKLRFAETYEAILEATGQTTELSPERLDQAMQSLIGDNSQGNLALSYEDKVKMMKLAKERVSGRFKNDSEGFTKELLEILASAGGADGEASSDLAFSRQEIIDEIYEDRDMIREELAIQLKMRISKHLYGKKRQASDFVKPKYNETSAYAARAEANDVAMGDLEGRVGDMEEQKDFDREAFNELKKELSQRKKLKEDMLTGTLPRFAPYLRL